MINDGVVDIPEKEEKSIDAFLKELEKYYNRRYKIYKEYSNMKICEDLREYSNTVIAPKYGLDEIKWNFGYFPDSSTKASYSASHKEIIINVAHAVGNSKLPLSKQKIDFKKISIHVYHEWTHFKQDLRYRKTTGKPFTAQQMYAGKKYIDVPEEQMAFARGELKWINQNLKKTHPQEILKWIKKWGLVQSEDIAKVKKTNPKAYKKMLKYLVLFVLKKEAQEHLK